MRELSSCDPYRRTHSPRPFELHRGATGAERWSIGLDHGLLETAQERFNMQPTLRNSDAELLSAATRKLSQSYSALMPGLHIDAEQGSIIIISGRVSKRSERCSITQMLRTIPSVQAVVDHIDVGSAAFLSDHRLAKDALAVLTASGHM